MGKNPQGYSVIEESGHYTVRHYPGISDFLYLFDENSNQQIARFHVGPDGDTLGSMLALKHGLEKVFDHIHGIHCVIAGKGNDVETSGGQRCDHIG